MSLAGHPGGQVIESGKVGSQDRGRVRIALADDEIVRGHTPSRGRLGRLRKAVRLGYGNEIPKMPQLHALPCLPGMHPSLQSLFRLYHEAPVVSCGGVMDRFAVPEVAPQAGTHALPVIPHRS